jgi:hypothetical protein
VRAILTGALAGAQSGLPGIPQRFLGGIDDADRLQGLAKDLATAIHTPWCIGYSLRSIVHAHIENSIANIGRC